MNGSISEYFTTQLVLSIHKLLSKKHKHRKKKIELELIQKSSFYYSMITIMACQIMAIKHEMNLYGIMPYDCYTDYFSIAVKRTRPHGFQFR